MQHYRLGEGPYGSAYHGSIDDILAAGDLAPMDVDGRVVGLFLGHFDWVQTIRHVWEEPKKGIWGWLGGTRVSRDHVERIPQVHDFRFTGDLHHLVVASTGAGKFRDALANMLLYDGSCETSCLVIDPKGEIASTVGPALDEPGADDPRTIILDPWNVCGTGLTHALTLLDGIRPDNPHCVKDARVLADAIIVERGQEEGHWAETAKNFLAGLLLHLGTAPREVGRRNLRRLREIVTLPWEDFVYLLGVMTDSPAFGGIIARAGQAMLNRQEKERRNILSIVERDTAFIEDPNLWKAIEADSFDLNDLVRSDKRLHVIVPFDYTKEMRSWLRLTIAAYYNACLRNPLDARLPSYLRFRHIIIDEFAGLGRLDFIVKDIAEARGAGIKYHIVVQGLNQLEHLYDKGWETFVANSVIQAFGINDQFTADYLSKLCGQATVVTQSSSFSESTSVTHSHSSGSSWSGHHSSSTSGSSTSTTSGTSRSQTFSTTGRPVLMPDEIRRLPSDRQLLFLRGMPVLMGRRTHYDVTFRNMLPRHRLRDVITDQSVRRLTDQRRLRPYDGSQARTASPRAAANSGLRVTDFRAPPYRPYTLRQALLQSPIEIVVAVLIVVLMGSVTFERIQAGMVQAAEKAKAKQLADLAEKDAQQREAEARAIDARLRAPYAAMAGPVFSAIEQAGLCLKPPAPTDLIRCTGSVAFRRGADLPINLQFETKPPRAYLARFVLAPTNSKRGASVDGISGTIDIATLRQEDFAFASLPDQLKVAATAILSAFGLPTSAMDDCAAGRGVTPQTYGPVAVSCSFNRSGANRRQFTMKLEKQS